MADSRNSSIESHIKKLPKDAEIVGIQKLGTSVTYVDTDECKWVDTGFGTKRCEPVSGRPCPSGSYCNSYSITWTVGGTTYTSLYCECK
jgi:hypothetical protein